MADELPQLMNSMRLNNQPEPEPEQNTGSSLNLMDLSSEIKEIIKQYHSVAPTDLQTRIPNLPTDFFEQQLEAQKLREQINDRTSWIRTTRHNIIPPSSNQSEWMKMYRTFNTYDEQTLEMLQQHLRNRAYLKKLFSRN